MAGPDVLETDASSYICGNLQQETGLLAVASWQQPDAGRTWDR